MMSVGSIELEETMEYALSQVEDDPILTSSNECPPNLNPDIAVNDGKERHPRRGIRAHLKSVSPTVP